MHAPAAGYRPSGYVRSGLRQQAHADFTNARGARHLALLLEAKRRREKELTDCRQELASVRLKYESFKQRRDAELLVAVQRSLVENRLTEVPGLGVGLRQNLLDGVFRGKLTDLHGASHIPGIGPQRQAAIDAWVARYQPQLAALSRQPFPGSEAVYARYHKDMQHLQSKADALARDEADLTRRLKQIGDALAPLMAVTAADFQAAFEHPEADAPSVHAYLLGVYPPWEPAPAWFKQETGSDV